MFANTLATVFSQSAFTYQILASSLPANKKNMNEDIRDKLKSFTNGKQVLSMGLKYTVPVAMYNTVLEILVIKKIS